MTMADREERWFELADIARREEARQAEGVRAIADVCEPWLGGVLARSGPGAWCNAAVGAGLDADQPEVGRDAIERMIAWYAEHGIEPRIELAPCAHPSLVRRLADAGFVVRHFENVFFRGLRAGERIATPMPSPAGLRIRAVDPSDARDVDLYARTSIAGFLPPGVEPTEELLALARRTALDPRSVAIVAELDCVVAGAGAMEVAPPSKDGVGIAALFGVTVLPDARRRGVQQQMLAWRLELAASRGASLATIGSRPGVATERNVRRMGFAVAYTKVILVRPAPGLVPVLE
jgi:GNAT superfamily N-acetyltransferase